MPKAVVPLAASLTAASQILISPSALETSPAALSPSCLVDQGPIVSDRAADLSCTLHFTHVSAVGRCAADSSVHYLHVCLIVFLPQAGLMPDVSPTGQTE